MKQLRNITSYSFCMIVLAKKKKAIKEYGRKGREIVRNQLPKDIKRGAVQLHVIEVEKQRFRIKGI